jgi:hypothetical protein
MQTSTSAILIMKKIYFICKEKVSYIRGCLIKNSKTGLTQFQFFDIINIQDVVAIYFFILYI